MEEASRATRASREVEAPRDSMAKQRSRSQRPLSQTITIGPLTRKTVTDMPTLFAIGVLSDDAEG
jgi:hypothetical protein